MCLPSDSFALYNIEPHFETKVVEMKCEFSNQYQYEDLNAALPDVQICGRALILSSQKCPSAPERKLIQRKESLNAQTL